MKERQRKMINKKSIIIIITICMLIGLLTACGSETDSTDPTTEPSTTVTQTSSISEDSMQNVQEGEESYLTEGEKKQIVNAVFEEVKKMDDGDSATTAKLMIKIGYDVNSYPPLEIVDVHTQLVELAKENNIILDQSKYDGMIVGLPQNLEFIVRK